MTNLRNLLLFGCLTLAFLSFGHRAVWASPELVERAIQKATAEAVQIMTVDTSQKCRMALWQRSSRTRWIRGVLNQDLQNQLTQQELKVIIQAFNRIWEKEHRNLECSYSTIQCLTDFQREITNEALVLKIVEKIRNEITIQVAKNENVNPYLIPKAIGILGRIRLGIQWVDDAFGFLVDPESAQIYRLWLQDLPRKLTEVYSRGQSDDLPIDHVMWTIKTVQTDAFVRAARANAATVRILVSNEHHLKTQLQQRLAFLSLVRIFGTASESSLKAGLEQYFREIDFLANVIRFVGEYSPKRNWDLHLETIWDFYLELSNDPDRSAFERLLQLKNHTLLFSRNDDTRKLDPERWLPNLLEQGLPSRDEFLANARLAIQFAENSAP